MDDCIKFKFKRYHTLERYNRQNFALNIAFEWLFPTLYRFIWSDWCFLKKLMVDDRKKVSEGKGLIIVLFQKFLTFLESIDYRF